MAYINHIRDVLESEDYNATIVKNCKSVLVEL